MHIGKSSGLLLAVLALLAWPIATSSATSVEDRTAFFRLLASYQHGDEIIDFDIVVGCAVRVTRWGDGDRSYDAFRDPVAYVKATKDGGAILQMVPAACAGETTENGKIPGDFLPGALWFDDANNLSFGTAYVTEDAYEGPLSKLKFLGASIWPATRVDYVAFEPIAAQNLIDPRPLFTILPPVDTEELKRHFGDSRALAKVAPSMDCNSVSRFHLTDPAHRAVIRKYWPASRPRYWMPSAPVLEAINEEIGLYNKLQVDGRPIVDYFQLNHHTGRGFPTRLQGGTMGSEQRLWDKLPPTVFPLRQDDGIPWIKDNYLSVTILYRDIDRNDDAYKGFAYCYGHVYGRSLRVPAYLTGSFRTRIDGELIFGEDTDGRMARDRPWPFFERDEYFYQQDNFGLN